MGNKNYFMQKKARLEKLKSRQREKDIESATVDNLTLTQMMGSTSNGHSEVIYLKICKFHEIYLIQTF